MEKSSWSQYIEQTKEKPPRPLLLEAIQYVTNRNAALDIGSGALNDSIFLLKEGFANVTAVDQEPLAQEIANSLPKEKFHYVISKIEDLELAENAYEMINAQFSLPFISSQVFTNTFLRLLSSLKKGGVFSGQFFGVNDEWKDNPAMTFLTEEEALQLIQGTELLHFKEIEEDKATAAGTMKHWHIFNFILKK